MGQQISEKALDPYERRTLNLLKNKGKLKFAEIIMRLGLTVKHGNRVLESLKEKGYVVFNSDNNRFLVYRETE